MANLRPRETLLRFAVWACEQRDKGLHITPADVCVHFDADRATAYRWITDYFAARGWQWPREKEVLQTPYHEAERARWTKRRRYSAFNHPKRGSGCRATATTNTAERTS